MYLTAAAGLTPTASATSLALVGAPGLNFSTKIRARRQPSLPDDLPFFWTTTVLPPHFFCFGTWQVGQVMPHQRSKEAEGGSFRNWWIFLNARLTLFGRSLPIRLIRVFLLGRRTTLHHGGGRPFVSSARL
jgi:hypothetical protein